MRMIFKTYFDILSQNHPTDNETLSCERVQFLILVINEKKFSRIERGQYKTQ